MAVQESVVADAGYIPIDRRSESFGTAIDDRNHVQRTQGDIFSPVMPPPPTRVDAHVAELEKQVANEKRGKTLASLSPLEKQLFLAREAQREEQDKADAAAEAKTKRIEWETEQGDKLARLKLMREVMTVEPGFKASQVIEVDRTIKQLSTVGSDTATGAKMYNAVSATFDTVLDEIAVRETAAIMGAQNRLAALQAKRAARQAITEPDPVLSPEDLAFKAHYAEVQAAKAAGDINRARTLQTEYWAKRGEQGEAQ